MAFPTLRSTAVPVNLRRLLGKNSARPNPSLRFVRPADRTPPPHAREPPCQNYKTVAPRAKQQARFAVVTTRSANGLRFKPQPIRSNSGADFSAKPSDRVAGLRPDERMRRG